MCSSKVCHHQPHDHPTVALSASTSTPDTFQSKPAAMFVVKRDGRQQPVQFDKITARITKLCYGLNPDFVDGVRDATGAKLANLAA